MLRINDVAVIPVDDSFTLDSVLEDYRKLNRPKPDVLTWCVNQGFVRIAPAVPVVQEKRKPRKSLSEVVEAMDFVEATDKLPKS